MGLLMCATAACGLAAAAMAAPPQLYSQAAYQSPVSGDPDDLLLIAGYGFSASDTVVYCAVRDSTRPATMPSRLPTHSTATLGVAPIVSAADLPYSLTVRLPRIMRPNQSYALWVRTAGGEWSRPIMINDARPLWFSPAFVYASRAPAGLPHELKIVGRNLNPAEGQITRVRLVGPQQYTGTPAADPNATATLTHYVARLPLPATLKPGSYRIQVSRDGTGWVALAGQQLEVRPDQGPAKSFSIADPEYGGCRPDDGQDDTSCIVRAIRAASRAGGGTVEFGSGTWDLIGSSQAGVAPTEGIHVPPGVNLRGGGSHETRLRRHTEWHAAVFTLERDSVISGFTFQDLQVYAPDETADPFVQLGADFQHFAGVNAPADAAAVRDIVITRNVFDRTFIAIGSGGLPISRLFVTYNTFGAYSGDVELAGNRYNMKYRFRIEDSVIDNNTFKPSSKLDLSKKTGVIASELGAGLRVDFSGNTADGSSTDFLYAAGDPKGWRAAFFWNMNDNVEETLVSQNTASCTGDKIGDGEAIALDNNGNTFAFGDLAMVTEATEDSVTVQAPLVAKQSGQDIPAQTYYIAHWLQIGSGPGVGQARRIVGYSTDADTHRTTFKITPGWDVIPIPQQTRIAVGREFWQMYVLDNRVDNRMPLCQKSNRSRHAAGVIGMWAQSADSVIAGNHQYDSDGILVQQNMVVPEHPCPDCTMDSYLQAFLEIRSNVIDGEYNWNVDCSSSGIAIGVAAAPWGASPPATVGFGVAIAHNEIIHADGQKGGAIAQIDSWYPGPKPYRWPLSDNLLIHHNIIADIDGPSAFPVCGTNRHARVGIAFPDVPIAWRTVLYANSCRNVSVPVGGGAVDLVKVCPTSASDSCECPATAK